MFSDVTSLVIPLLSHVLLRCQFSASGQLEFYYGGKLQFDLVLQVDCLVEERKGKGCSSVH